MGPARLLAIGLPLTIGAGAFVGWLLFPALGLGFALLMGSILAPTDAALSLPLLVDRAIRSGSGGPSTSRAD